MATQPYRFKKSQINSTALKQDIYWYDRSAQLHVIANMNKYHCLGAISKLMDQFGTKVLTTSLAKALINRAEEA